MHELPVANTGDQITPHYCCGILDTQTVRNQRAIYE